MKKIISIILAVCLTASLSAAFAFSPGDSRAAIGANLNESQIAQVYDTFGIARGSVTELTVTNAEERQYLKDYVDESVIGSNSISCVYIEIGEAGSGLSVTASNINWCTEEMYRNALVTAGIEDAAVIVTAPVAVSGTAALTGIYKAYEDITGAPMDEIAKLIGTQELVITAELADQIGSYDAAAIVNELKLILDETKNMTDEQLRQQIVSIAEAYNVTITDTQIDQLISLCRSLEKLDSSELKARVESVQKTIKKLSEAKNTATKISEGIKNFFQAVSNFLTSIFGKK